MDFNICGFVFAHAIIRFSHDSAHLDFIAAPNEKGLFYCMMYRFVSFLASRPSKQFLSHVGTEPPPPGYYQYFWEVHVNVSCSRTQHGDLSEDQTPTSNSGVRRSTTWPSLHGKSVLC